MVTKWRSHAHFWNHEHHWWKHEHYWWNHAHLWSHEHYGTMCIYGTMSIISGNMSIIGGTMCIYETMSIIGGTTVGLLFLLVQHLISSSKFHEIK